MNEELESRFNADDLREELDERFIYQREGPHGKMLDYVPAALIISQLNKHFGYGGWSSHIHDLSKQGNEWICLMSIVVDDVTRTDVGVGDEPKDAVSDAIKRVSRSFGKQFGLKLWVPRS